jgi:hypothetical protein
VRNVFHRAKRAPGKEVNGEPSPKVPDGVPAPLGLMVETVMLGDVYSRRPVMKRRAAFTKQDVRELQAFALSVGLDFAHDTSVQQNRRRVCVHEAGHAVMYLGFGLEGWRIELRGEGAESFIPPVPIKPEVMILMSLGGPLAEARLCGPKGVLVGALDDVWQLKEAAEGQDLGGVRVLVQQAHLEVAKREAQVLAIADILDETGSFSSDALRAAEPGASSRPASSRRKARGRRS